MTIDEDRRKTLARSVEPSFGRAGNRRRLVARNASDRRASHYPPLRESCTYPLRARSFAAAFRSVRNAGATKRTRDFSTRPRLYAPAKRSAHRGAALGGLCSPMFRAYIACDVCTTGKWYPRTALRRVPCRAESRATSGRSRARETRTEVETPWRIGKGALSACRRRRPSSPPETRLAACGFALPLFASLSPFLRERGACPSSPPLLRSRAASLRWKTLQPFLPAPPRRGGSAFSPQVHVYGVSSKYERSK